MWRRQQSSTAVVVLWRKNGDEKLLREPPSSPAAVGEPEKQRVVLPSEPQSRPDLQGSAANPQVTRSSGDGFQRRTSQTNNCSFLFLLPFDAFQRSLLLRSGDLFRQFPRSPHQNPNRPLLLSSSTTVPAHVQDPDGDDSGE
ncbi:hypothetical protein MRB53_006964 [Persea americana]|uniref:Uncharacterized protein n=1 Tax=Persea americana TaxID=3435 RepID=A0ACC2MIL0_PERAE|nr:hypothetical protein MRB53_006964 [Persea americana]